MAGSIGNLWLKQKFGLEHNLTHQSELGTRLRLEIDQDGNVVETYSPQYEVGDSVLEHIEFGLKYDHLNLDLLSMVFKKLPTAEDRPVVDQRQSTGHLEILPGHSQDAQSP